MITLSLTLAAATAAFSSATAAPDDWPIFLGPTKDGVAPWPTETFEWPEDGPRVVWRHEAGPGYGGVAVADGEVFLFDHEKGERSVLRVFSLEDGTELWSSGFEQLGRISFDGSRSVPAIVGRRVIATSGFGQVACFDRDEKKLVWRVDMKAELGGAEPTFGWSGNPTIVGDTVIVTPLGEESGLAALSLEDGSERWRTGHVGFSHSTPVVVNLLGEDQLLFVACPFPASGKDEAREMTLWSFDPKTGEENWRHELLMCRIPIPSPLRIDASRLFLTGGYRAGSVLLRFDEGDDGAPKITEEFRSTRGSQTHQAILSDGHLYFLANENWTEKRPNRDEGGLTCLDLEGNELWRTGAEPMYGRGGFVQVADALLIQDGYEGTLTAVRVTPKEYTELGRAPVLEPQGRDGQMWAPLAVSGTRILMRSQAELVCVEMAPTADDDQG